MNATVKKLNFKDQSEVVLLNLPPDLAELKQGLAEYATVYESADKLPGLITFAVVFVQTLAEIEDAAGLFEARLEGDAIVWFCYPKGRGKRYKCEFNRDTGWQALGRLNLEGVRQVAIDDDWSALRFRRVEYIKTFTRSEKMILSDKGREKKQS